MRLGCDCSCVCLCIAMVLRVGRLCKVGCQVTKIFPTFRLSPLREIDDVLFVLLEITIPSAAVSNYSRIQGQGLPLLQHLNHSNVAGRFGYTQRLEHSNSQLLPSDRERRSYVVCKQSNNNARVPPKYHERPSYNSCALLNILPSLTSTSR